MTAITLVYVLCGLLAFGFLAAGALFILNPKLAYEYTTHREEALPAVMGGRYLGLGAFVTGLLWVGNYASLSIAFGVGAFLGYFDAIVNGRVGGKLAGHIIIGTVAALLSFYFYKQQVSGA